MDRLSLPYDFVGASDRRGALDKIAENCDVGLGLMYEASGAPNAALFAGLLATFPEAAFPLGFDEIRYAAPRVDNPDVSESAAGAFQEAAEEMLPRPAGSLFLEVVATTQYRTPNGMWHDIEAVLDKIAPHVDDHDELAAGTTETWLKSIEEADPILQSTLSLPAFSVPVSFGDSILHKATQTVLRELHNHETTLVDLHWRTMEEIVAELLHDLGLQVTVTDRSNDGGRDVIARGELIPGEPTLIAVEVKHKKVVPVSDIRDAMWANRHFPALMFVTSGRLSAGVYRERMEKEGMLRLFLKDGRGLEQWIDQYVKRNF